MTSVLGTPVNWYLRKKMMEIFVVAVVVIFVFSIVFRKVLQVHLRGVWNQLCKNSYVQKNSMQPIQWFFLLPKFETSCVKHDIYYPKSKRCAGWHESPLHTHRCYLLTIQLLTPTSSFCLEISPPQPAVLGRDWFGPYVPVLDQMTLYYSSSFTALLLWTSIWQWVVTGYQLYFMMKNIG